MEECLFCKIVAGDSPSERVLETDNFIVIKNKYPKAPVHLLVLDNVHHKKSGTISGSQSPYWDGIIAAAYLAIQKFGLDKTGYKLVVNGAGYNHFDHEHMHIMGGTTSEPCGES